MKAENETIIMSGSEFIIGVIALRWNQTILKYDVFTCRICFPCLAISNFFVQITEGYGEDNLNALNPVSLYVTERSTQDKNIAYFH